MPIYEYQCADCKNSCDLLKSIANRNEPCDNGCIKCGGVVQLRISAPPFIGDGGFSMSKVPDAFKDKLRALKNGTVRSTIDV